MKKLLIAISLLLVISMPTNSVFAQDDILSGVTPRYKNVITQTFGKIRFDLYCKTGSWGDGQQFFAANCFNSTFYDVHVTGEYAATLVCGNEAVAKIDITVKKYGSIIHVDPNDPNYPTSLPKGFGSDFTGMVNSADSKRCLGNVVWVDGYFGKPTRDRISGLGIRKLKLFVVQDDGSEVPMTAEGVMISPPVNTNQIATNNGYQNGGSQQSNGNLGNVETIGRQAVGATLNNDDNAVRQRQIEERRQGQLNILNEKMRQQSVQLEAVTNGIGELRDLIVGNMMQKSINSDNADRQKRFNELEEDIKTKKGDLVDCNECSGRGYDVCNHCDGNGFNICSNCSGNGSIKCYRCSGTGYAFGVKCVTCGGSGSSECSYCFGKGKNICTYCYGLGKIQCIRCRGTSKEFKEN